MWYTVYMHLSISKLSDETMMIRLYYIYRTYKNEIQKKTETGAEDIVMNYITHMMRH